MTIAYDGTDFHGWQKQPVDLSVAECLEKTYEKIFKQSINIVGGSRTDAGVHALNQVAMFKTHTVLPEADILRVHMRHFIHVLMSSKKRICIRSF